MTARRCQSRSEYGSCWLTSKHAGEHAVPIGPDFWFAYPRPRTDGLLGYAVFCGDQLVPVPHYCDDHCPQCACSERDCRDRAITRGGLMTAAATVSDVAVDPDLARRLATAGKKAEEWKDRRDDLIREAARNGGTLREIAALVDMSNPGVLRVIRRGPLETRHITPLHQGGSKDDPDNLRFVSPEENARRSRKDD